MNLIAYYRVSTTRQGQSGLGLEAQRQAVLEFAKLRGHVVVGEITEVQSGKDDSRPELARALSQARRERCAVVVAKLDRLARSARFLGEILESGVDVLFCNLPDLPPGATGKFMVQLMASLAEMEANLISDRTKAALQAAKARGTKLGGFRGTAASPKAREASAKARSGAADRRALELQPLLCELALEGHGPRAIAQELNERAVPTPSGHGAWHASTVSSAMQRVERILQRDVEQAQKRAASHAAWTRGVTQ